MENNTSDDVIDQQEPISDVITEEPSDAVSDQTGGDTPEQTTDTAEPIEDQAPMEFKDDYWKNQAMEYKRKAGNIAEEIPEIVKKAVQEVTQSNQNSQFSDEQLEAVLRSENYDQASKDFATLELKRRQEQSISKLKEEIKNETKQEFLQQQRRIQVEQQVANDPRFSDAFIVNQLGQKVVNPNSPLAQRIGQYMSQQEFSVHPEGLLYAAKAAYADLAGSTAPQVKQKVEKLERNNAKLKQAQQLEGGGMTPAQKAKDSFVAAKEQLAKTGRIEDARIATKEYLKKIGYIKE